MNRKQNSTESKKATSQRSKNSDCSCTKAEAKQDCKCKSNTKQSR